MSSSSYDCQLGLSIDLHFSGGLLPDILDLFKSLLEKEITSLVQTEGCKALDGLLSNTTTQLLQFIDKGVAQYVVDVLCPAFGPGLALCYRRMVIMWSV